MHEFVEVLDGKFELTQVCPGRKRFHQTEVVAFFGTVGYYFGIQGDIERARPYHKTLRLLDPKSPMTKRLDRVMWLASLNRLFVRTTRTPRREPSRSFG